MLLKNLVLYLVMIFATNIVQDFFGLLEDVDKLKAKYKEHNIESEHTIIVTEHGYLALFKLLA